MDNLPQTPEIQPFNITPESQEPAISKTLIIGLVVSAVLIGFYVVLAKNQSWWPFRNKKEVCIQVITPALNPETGEVREFPTPCDVPEGWVTEKEIIPEEAKLKTQIVFDITNIQMLGLDLKNYYKLKNKYPSSLREFMDDNSYSERSVFISRDRLDEYRYSVSSDFQHFVLSIPLLLSKDKIGLVNGRQINMIKDNILGVSCLDPMIFCETD